jgi:AraC-like DNA-binding protein
LKQGFTKTTPHIALVTAAFAEPFRIAMQNNGIDPEWYFRQNGLPLADLEDPASLIPQKPFWRLVNQVATSEGIPDFGMQVAQTMPWIEIETMRPLLIAQPDLKSLLTTFCDIASSQSSNVTFALSCEDETCSFERLGRPLIGNDIQMELYRLTSMIELVQVFTGRGWRPVSVRLLMDDNKIAGVNRILAGIELSFAQNCTAIVFPAELLDAPRRATARRKISPGSAASNNENLKTRTDIISALRKILINYVTEENLSINLIADVAGMSARSLQRVLKSQGFSYRDLLDETRLNYAVKHLQNPSTDIGDIAKHLGYSDAAHFTRAFKGWTGVSPSTYRIHGDSITRPEHITRGTTAVRRS